MRKQIEMDFEYLPTIDTPPLAPSQLQKQAASNDDPTIESWRETWIANQKRNHDLFGPFAENGIGKIFGEFHLKPCIIVGSGPSLANNIEDLKEAKEIPIVSCLHNFHYLIDNDIDVNYFVTLDAGKVTIEEISEGGKHDHEYYLEQTANHTLVAFVGTDPELIKSWKGKVLWYNCPIPDQRTKDAFDSVEVFHNLMTNGGNVLGACLYLAKAYLGANPIAYVGADFAFGYKKNFHPWPSKYDGKLGHVLRAIDCWGNKVLTWQSYHNFKKWHDSIAMRVPGEFINCTEGGTFGVYPEGLIKYIRHKPLKEFIQGYKLYETMKYQAENPNDGNEILHESLPPQPKLFF